MFLLLMMFLYIVKGDTLSAVTCVGQADCQIIVRSFLPDYLALLLQTRQQEHQLRLLRPLLL